MNIMRIQQEFVAKGLEPARTFDERVRASEARAFLTRSLGWELRLARLRAEAAGETKHTPTAESGAATAAA
jgi:hypothetical protein